MKPIDFISNYKLGGAPFGKYYLSEDKVLSFEVELIRSNQLGELSRSKKELIPAKVTITNIIILNNIKNFNGFSVNQDGEISSFSLVNKNNIETANNDTIIGFDFFLQDYSTKEDDFIELLISADDIRIDFIK